jgi:hypothetical protein
MLNCSGVRMACHSSSDFCTGPGGGVDDDIAATLGGLRPAAPRDADAAAWPRHGRAAHARGADRGRAAEGEGARRREESGRAARGAKAAAGAGREHECDAILSLSRRWTPMFSFGSSARHTSATCRFRCLIRFWTRLLWDYDGPNKKTVSARTSDLDASVPTLASSRDS